MPDAIKSVDVPSVHGVVVLNPDGTTISGGSSGGGTEYTDGAATPASPKGGIPVFNNAGTITAVSNTNPLPISVKQLNGTTISTGNGTTDAGTQRVTLSSDGTVGISQTTPGTTNKVTLGSDVVHTIVDSGTTAVTQGTATNLKTQAECYQGGSAVAAGNPLQVSLANHAANATAVKVNIASGGIASGGIASGAIASGAIAAGAIAAGATSIAANEDDASAGGDRMVKVAAVRLDTPVSGANVSASGDYLPLFTDSYGKLWTASNQTEDAAHASGDRGSFVLAVRTDSAAASSGTTGDYEALHTDANGKLWTNAEISVALPAGTNAIGKLAANSGVDIGDVDVTSITNGSLNGPGAPTIDSYTKVAISAVTGTNQQLIAAPGVNKQIWVYGIGFTCSVAGTVAIQDEDETAITGVMSFAQYSGPLNPPSGNFAMPLWKVATNKALEADVTTATINGWIAYAIVSV